MDATIATAAIDATIVCIAVAVTDTAPQLSCGSSLVAAEAEASTTAQLLRLRLPASSGLHDQTPACTSSSPSSPPGQLDVWLGTAISTNQPLGSASAAHHHAHHRPEHVTHAVFGMAYPRDRRPDSHPRSTHLPELGWDLAHSSSVPGKWNLKWEVRGRRGRAWEGGDPGDLDPAAHAACHGPPVKPFWTVCTPKVHADVDTRLSTGNTPPPKHLHQARHNDIDTCTLHAIPTASPRHHSDRMHVRKHAQPSDSHYYPSINTNFPFTGPVRQLCNV
ncbi:hypothetical protein CcaCcLH18_07086 [Colletotrichum camelliae]|nr:hypothetical protein CcaCcLH18_07086 [Colletotrichum camelliae]